MRKRGDDFWCEFEFYLSDLIVGMVLDVVLVTLLAPVAVIGAHPKSAQATGAQTPSRGFLIEWLACGCHRRAPHVCLRPQVRRLPAMCRLGVSVS